MSNNILLSGDNEITIQNLRKKLVLLRACDKINICACTDVIYYLDNNYYDILVLCAKEDDSHQTLKIIDNIKKHYPKTEIILYSEKLEAEYMLDAYDKGIYDFITPDSENYEITMKLINCMRMKTLKNNNDRMKLLLENIGAISTKNGLFQFKYIKEIFNELTENPKIKNGIFVILNLDENVKTKVSTNRLNLLIKKTLRLSDIAATGSGKVYLILENTDLNGAKSVIEKIQDNMGAEFKLHAGVSKIESDDFETINKNASDSLQAAIRNDDLFVCLTEQLNYQNEWLADEDTSIKPSKQYKLFSMAFANKLKHVIEPCFYRFAKTCETKDPDLTINHYCNKIESVFSIKKDNAHSELVIRYDGYTKFIVEIIHKGLDTDENTKVSIPINKITDKDLQKLLKKLKQEFENGHA